MKVTYLRRIAELVATLRHPFTLSHDEDEAGNPVYYAEVGPYAGHGYTIDGAVEGLFADVRAHAAEVLASEASFYLDLLATASPTKVSNITGQKLEAAICDVLAYVGEAQNRSKPSPSADGARSV